MIYPSFALYLSLTSLPPSSSGAPLKRAKLGAMRSCFPWRQKMALKAKSFGQIFGRSLENSPNFPMENHHVLIGKPIGSMYAIYGNIYHQYTPNVSIYHTWILWEINKQNFGYPLVNLQKATETLELFIGKSTINGQFSIVNVGKTMSKPTHDWEW